MTALGYYANATDYILSSTELDENYFLLLQESLTPLRFYLACRVCNRLLQEPMTPDHTACQHTVCSSCVGGKMRLRPACGWCQGYENFKPNLVLGHLVKCYSKLCNYVHTSAHYNQQLVFIKDNPNPDIRTYKEKVASLIREGCDYTPLSDNCSPSSNQSTIIAEPTDLASAAAQSTATATTNTVASEPVSTTTTPSDKSSRKLARRRASHLDQDGGSAVTPPKHKLRLSVDQLISSPQVTRDEPQDPIEQIGSKRGRLSVKQEKKGCACGTAAMTPGKLTCYGQRCSCYSNHNPCLDCRCKGCRNPNKYVKIENASEDTDNDEINVV